MIRFFFLLTIISLIGCSRKNISSLKRQGVQINQSSLSIEAGNTGKIIQIQYLGCGGLFIRQPGLSVMIDPFFSHQRFFKIGRAILLGGKIRSKPKQIHVGQQRILDSLHIAKEILAEETRAIFAAHGHYDHLMDIPYVQQRWLNGKADVYVNNSSFNTCSRVIAADKLHDIEPIMAVRDQPGRSVNFNTSDGSVLRVYPILAAHNPHTKNIKLFSGSVMHPAKEYNDPEKKTRIDNWLEGRTLSFLIDIEKDNTILFRLFVQSSSAYYPDGLPPEILLSKRPVDLAVLGVASYHFSETTYPCEYVKKLQPKNVMFIHWEDFFRPYNRKPKSILKNDLPRFFNEIIPACIPKYILPVPGVVVNVKY